MHDTEHVSGLLSVHVAPGIRISWASLPDAATPSICIEAWPGAQEPALPAKLASKKRLTKQGALGGHSEASKPLAASLGSSKDAAVLVGEDLGDVTQTLLPPEFPDLPVRACRMSKATDAVRAQVVGWP